MSHRLPIALAALQNDYEVVLLTNVVNHREDIERLGIRVEHFNVSRGRISLIFDIRRIFEMRRFIRKLKPNILHVVGMKPIIIAGLSTLFDRKIEIVYALTGLGYVFTSEKLKAKFLRVIIRPLLRIILNRSNSVTIVQNSDDEVFLSDNLNILKKKITVIRGSGVDTTEYFGISESLNFPPVIAMVSRLLGDKGVYELVEASKLLKKRGTSFRLVLVGNIDKMNPSSIPENTIKEWVTQGLIEWQGYRKDIKNVWMEAHICVLPSYREGLPKSLLEAAACARPVITTDAPGCKDIVEHNITGLVVPVKSITELADAIESLVNDRNLRIKMGLAGRERVISLFDKEIITEQTLKLYNSMLNQNKC